MYDLANKKWFQQKNNPEIIRKQENKKFLIKKIETEKPNKWTNTLEMKQQN